MNEIFTYKKRIVFFIFLLACLQALGQNVVIKDTFETAKSAKLGGYISDRLYAAYQHRILEQDVQHLIEPFKNRTETTLWQSEFWGKWFTSAILAYKYRPEDSLKNILESAANQLLATQTSDGYIGNYKSENHLQQWDIWGRKYVMLGLLDYYELSQKPIYLASAQKVADHVIKEIKEADGQIITKGNYRGMAASSILEPMVKLYRLTNNKKYLNFGQEIVRQWETPQGPKLLSKAKVDVSKRFPKAKNWYSWEQGQKAYEMMSCYEGLLELYRVTGNYTYKKAVEATWQNIKDTEIDVAGSGAAVEMWFGGKKAQTTAVKHFQETCVTVTWIKLNQQLLRLTGQAKYADEIEKSYYNALLATLSTDGSEWAKYTPLNGQRLKASGQCGMNLNCCDASGSRGLFTLPLTAVMQTAKGLAVNFFVEGNYQVLSPKKQAITLRQKTIYPQNGSVSVGITLQYPEEIAIQLRIPYWSKNTKVTVNGQVVDHVQAGSYVTIKRIWSTNDQIALSFDLQGRLEKVNNHYAVHSGPLILARDSMFEGSKLAMNLDPKTSQIGRIHLQPVPKTKANTWVEYTAMFIPESYTESEAEPIEIHLCDYASAGNIEEKSFFKVWNSSIFNPAKE
jgi:uncharacterized protein